MKVGTLVKHIEYEYIGILLEKNDFDHWLVHWGNSPNSDDWYSECEMEVINGQKMSLTFSTQSDTLNTSP